MNGELKRSVFGAVLVDGDAMEFVIRKFVRKRDHAVVVMGAALSPCNSGLVYRRFE